MRSWCLVWFSMVVLLGAAIPARAADVPVRYLIAAKALKDAVAGTQLTFALFSDAACETQVFSSDLPVESATIEQLKLTRPKGAPKAPKAARLEITLTGVTPGDSLYLMVTGTGIEPLGTACQAQLAVPPTTALTGDNIADGSLSLGDLGGAGGGPFMVTVGSDISLPAGECHSQLTGNFGAGFIGYLVVGTLADANGDPVLPNSAAFVPSVVIGTTQGGAVPNLVVCNTGTGLLTIPAGSVFTWRMIAP